MSIFGPRLKDDVINDLSLNGFRMTDLGNPQSDTDATNKGYVIRSIYRRQRHYITVWAEAKGELKHNKFQWGFGVSHANSIKSGYAMLMSRRVIRIALANDSAKVNSTVNIVVNGVDSGKGITKQAGVWCAYQDTLVNLNVGDVLNFKSIVPRGTVDDSKSSVISLLIEINI